MAAYLIANFKNLLARAVYAMHRGSNDTQWLAVASAVYICCSLALTCAYPSQQKEITSSNKGGLDCTKFRTM